MSFLIKNFSLKFSTNIKQKINMAIKLKKAYYLKIQIF